MAGWDGRKGIQGCLLCAKRVGVKVRGASAMQSLESTQDVRDGVISMAGWEGREGIQGCLSCAKRVGVKVRGASAMQSLESTQDVRDGVISMAGWDGREEGNTRLPIVCKEGRSEGEGG